MLGFDYADCYRRGLEVYSPFGNLPSRKLEDYYRLIRHPVSLKSIAKRTRGIHGRAPPSGITDFKTWDQYEEEFSYIWRNAKDYNEDGSDMYTLAIELEVRISPRRSLIRHSLTATRSTSNHYLRTQKRKLTSQPGHASSSVGQNRK